MDTYFGKLKYIKVGTIVTENVTGDNETEVLSAIKKYPISSAYIGKTGFIGDEQGDSDHHGGENKAVLFFSSITYNRINALYNYNFDFDTLAYYGENLLVSHMNEENVCIGDVLGIGDAIIEISQPRQPCWKLSINTGVNAMAKIIYKHGFTGWYGRVLKEGTISRDDMVVLKKRRFPELTISALNQLMIDPSVNPALVEKALQAECLGVAFKTSLENRYLHDSYDHLLYQTWE
ncbi:MOSC domain-containing protein [Sulfuricurvum sp.]|uniref:MOSC domain-containing protein n=1 Tax=Sulfuricurvum sp. TaxID=2025608 RepID=UPI002636140D|nr:MOSC domain-containing protein [Sulfuricurvum sp.]MDD4885123.1 MOSC domain-containing protein [Sulfuricurvum sp.]